MRVSRLILWVSFAAAITSLALYLCPVPAIWLSADQVNNLLLAIFGAACPSFAFGLLEYESRVRDNESTYLKLCERVYSEITGLKECVVGTITDDRDLDFRLVLAYLDELDCNTLSPSFSGTSHTARNNIIKEIEGCELNECCNYAMRPFSRSSIYLDQLESNLITALDSYRQFDSPFKKNRDAIKDLARDICYFMPHLSRNKKKTASISCTITLLETVGSCLSDSIGKANLFYADNGSFLDSFCSVKASEDKWASHNFMALGGPASGNQFCEQMYELVSQFALNSTSVFGEKFTREFGDQIEDTCL